MRIAIVGGGPGGLYFAALMKGLDEGHEITVWERNAPDDTFGFGVVFSDETLGSIEGADRVVHEQMESRFARWTDIDVTVTDATGNAQPFTVGGQGFAAMSRKELLRILQTRVADLGVTVHYRTEAPDPDELRASYDLVLAADGLNSVVRTKYADVFRPHLDRRHNKYIWFGTDLVFEAFQFFVKHTEWGTMQIHGYPYSDAGSTFIVEMHEDVWRRAGLDATEHQVFRSGRLGRVRRGADRGHLPRRARGSPDPDQQLEVAQLRHRQERTLARRQRRPARRRRPHRPLLDRLRHQARHGGRTGAGRLPARAPDRRRRAGRPTRTSASRSSSRPSGPPRPRSSGSRTSACTPTRTRPSSSSTCSPARAGSPSRTSRTATTSSPRGWRRSSRATRARPRSPRPCSSRSGSASWS